LRAGRSSGDVADEQPARARHARRGIEAIFILES
jgi:hypothetical protein